MPANSIHANTLPANTIATNTHPSNAANESNLFLAKLAPNRYTPLKNESPVSKIRWTAETVGAVATEALKAIPRASVRDMYDALNSALCVKNISSSLSTQVQAVANSTSIAEGAVNTVAGMGRAAGATLTSTLGWAAAFYAVHHIPRKLDSLKSSKPLSPSETLEISQEKKSLKDHSKNIIANVTQELHDANPTIVYPFLKDLVTETLMGNWQINHAFDQFNTSTKGEFSELVQEGQKQLPLPVSIQFENALQQADARAIKTLLPQLPAHLQVKTLDLLDTRLTRNITCFLSRAIREQRDMPTAFESQYLERWLDDYAMLHDTAALSSISKSELIAVMRSAMEKLGQAGEIPLLHIDSFPAEERPPSRWPKQLEQQLMQRFNQEHNHQMHNIDHLPKSGRAIIVFNHSLFTLDIGMALQSIRESHNRESTMVVDEALMSLPLVSSTLRSLGYRLAEKSSFMRQLSNEHLLAVAPGGSKEGLKPYENANQLHYWNRAKGFVRAHLVSGSPLMTVVSPQVDQLRKNQLPPTLHWVQKNIFSPLKVAFVPVFFAPNERERIRVDHYGSPLFEAPPMPFNNLSNDDPRFRHHVTQIHKVIQQDAQQRLNETNSEVLSETDGTHYPMAWKANDS